MRRRFSASWEFRGYLPSNELFVRRLVNGIPDDGESMGRVTHQK
jgi:hypothetical protein